MKPGLGARPGRSATSPAPGTDPVGLLITTAAVVLGLLAIGLPVRLPGSQPAPLPRAGGAPALPAGSSAAALRLLSGAAAATGAASYQGVEMLTWWGPGGTSATLADVWHRPGQEPVLQTAAPAQAWTYGAAGQPTLTAPAGRSLALLGLSQRLVSLIRANYAVSLGGRGEVAARPAVLVTVRRRGGPLAAQLWLDQATMLPLSREIFDTSGRPLGQDVFLSVSMGQAAGVAPAGRSVQAWHQLSAGQLASLRDQGWPLPGPLPARLTLIDARESTGPSGPVVHLAYSDGLAVVSVFIERGFLPPAGLPHSTRITVGGYRVYADDPDDGSLIWPARGFVFTMLAQAPARTVSAVVAALPHDSAGPPGLLARMRIGIRRLLVWLGILH